MSGASGSTPSVSARLAAAFGVERDERRRRRRNADDAFGSDARAGKAFGGEMRQHDDAIGEEDALWVDVVPRHAAYRLHRFRPPKRGHRAGDRGRFRVRCEKEVPEIDSPSKGEALENAQLVREGRSKVCATGRVHRLETRAAELAIAALPSECERVVAAHAEDEVAHEVLAGVVPGRLHGLGDEQDGGHAVDAKRSWLPRRPRRR